MLRNYYDSNEQKGVSTCVFLDTPARRCTAVATRLRLSGAFLVRNATQTNVEKNIYMCSYKIQNTAV